MEAVPKMPMLHLDLKESPEVVEFGPQIKKYISENYQEEGSSYEREIVELDELRQVACRAAPRDYTGCLTLKKYYAQLHMLQARINMGAGANAALPFTWADIYSENWIVHSDIRFEMACVLHNVGALHSFLGALDGRQSAEGRKISCTHFQCAAWAFQQLRDNYNPEYSTDFNGDILTFYNNLMFCWSGPHGLCRPHLLLHHPRGARRRPVSLLPPTDGALTAEHAAPGHVGGPGAVRVLCARRAASRHALPARQTWHQYRCGRCK